MNAQALRRGPWAAGLAGGLVLAVYTGLQLAGGGSGAATVLPLAVAGLIILAWLALTQFTAFVLVVLAIRASMDVAKLQGGLDVTAPTADTPPWLDPGAGLGLLFIVAGVTWLVAQGPRPADRRPPVALAMAAAAFLAAGVLSLVGSAAPATSAGEVLRIAAVIVMIFVVERLVADDPSRTVPLLVAAFAAAVAPVLTTAVQAVTHVGLVDVHGILRPHGTFWHPNVLGIFCALQLVMAVALVSHVRGTARTWLLVAVAGLGTALVMGSGRGPWLAAMAGLVVVALLQDRRILLVLGAAVAVVMVAVPSTMARLDELSTLYGPSGAAGNSLAWRFEHWPDALALIGDNPITGIGLGATKLLLVKEVHNDYLRALVETGVVGMLAYLALFAMLAVTAWRALRTTAGQTPSLPRGIAVGFAGCVATVAVFGIADNVMTTVVVLWYFAVYTGLDARLAERPVA